MKTIRKTVAKVEVTLQENDEMVSDTEFAYRVTDSAVAQVDGAGGKVVFDYVADAQYTLSFDIKIGPDRNKTGEDASVYMPI